MEDHELRELALQYIQGLVITSAQVPKGLWNLVWLPLGFIRNPKKALKGVRLVYAVIGTDTQTGQGINGWPIFASCRVMKIRELSKFTKYIEQANKLKRDFIQKQEK